MQGQHVTYSVLNEGAQLQQHLLQRFEIRNSALLRMQPPSRAGWMRNNVLPIHACMLRLQVS